MKGKEVRNWEGKIQTSKGYYGEVGRSAFLRVSDLLTRLPKLYGGQVF